MLDGEVETEGFTPTQLRLWAILRDEEPHYGSELLETLGDSQAEMINVQVHITYFRKKLRRQQRTIIALRNGRQEQTQYQLVRLVVNRI